MEIGFSPKFFASFTSSSPRPYGRIPLCVAGFGWFCEYQELRTEDNDSMGCSSFVAPHFSLSLSLSLFSGS